MSLFKFDSRKTKRDEAIKSLVRFIVDKKNPKKALDDFADNYGKFFKLQTHENGHFFDFKMENYPDVSLWNVLIAYQEYMTAENIINMIYFISSFNSYPCAGHKEMLIKTFKDNTSGKDYAMLDSFFFADLFFNNNIKNKNHFLLMEKILNHMMEDKYRYQDKERIKIRLNELQENALNLIR